VSMLRAAVRPGRGVRSSPLTGATPRALCLRRNQIREAGGGTGARGEIGRADKAACGDADGGGRTWEATRGGRGTWRR